MYFAKNIKRRRLITQRKHTMNLADLLLECMATPDPMLHMLE